jgi:phosphatidylglycerol---prolipoprotein diacylglyceryl transferase
VLISIDPIPLQLGEVGVGWFGLAALVGLLAGIALTLRLARMDGLPRGPLLDALAWTIPVGVVAARLVYLLGTWDQHVGDSESLWQLPLTGLSLWGGLVGGGVVAMSVLGARRVDRRRVADVVAPGLALGIAIGRFGELLQGIGQGLPTTLPWAVVYASPLAGAPDVGVPRHPAQLYDGVLALALLGALLLSRRWTIAPGVRWWTFLAVYGAGRILLGELRLDPAFLFGLQIDQLLAGASVLVALLALGATLSRLLAARPAPSPST